MSDGDDRPDGPPREREPGLSLATHLHRESVKARVFGDERRARLDRYIIEGKLGEGGTGSVFVGFDPQLDRKVAIKLLHEVGGHAPLEREARAMARLSHPNVVQVYEVGEHQGQCYIVMERVPGSTLRVAQAELRRRSSPRNVAREIIKLYEQAGRGLAAAHDVGLTHRDFKPENVLVDADGRARVCDFGLARMFDAQAQSRSRPRAPADALELVDGAPTPRTSVAGTPAYMAPEQLRGEAVSAHADQFSFCVALYEALEGQHPFCTQTLTDRPRAHSHMSMAGLGSRRPSNIPAHVWAALRRGLAAEPEARFDSMNALLRAITQEPTWRRSLAGAAIVVGLFVAIASWQRISTRWQRASCAEAGAEISSSWGARERTLVAASFEATELPYASLTATRVIELLDGHAQTWSQARESMCLDDLAQANPAQTDLTSECLAERRDELDALVELLAAADAATVQRAVAATLSLSAIEPCGDPSELRAMPMLPRDAGARARARALRHDLARAQALAQTSHYVEGYARAIDALAGARTLAHAPLVVEAQARAGNLAYQLGHFDEAELRLREAFDDSGPLAMDTLAVEVATGLAFVVGSERGRTDEGLLWVSFAARLLAQQHGPASAQANLLRARAAIYHYRGDYDQALADRVDVLDMLEASLGSEHPSVGRALQDLGETYFYRAQYELAIAHHERALMVLGGSLGEDHPALAASLVSIADAQRMHGDPHAARGLLERALAINIAALGPDHPNVANTLLSLGDLLSALDDDHAARLHLEHALAIAEREHNHATAGMALAAISSLDERAGDLDGAIRTCRRALTSTVEVLGEDHHDGGLIELQLGHLLREAGAWAEARQALEHALVLFDSQEGPELAVLLHELGRLDRAQGQHDQALAHHQRSLAIMEAYGAPGPELAEALLGVGLARLELGQPDAAVVELERALVLDGRDAISPMIRAELQFALARALRAAGARGSRARELALEAHAALDPAPIKYAALQAELDAWLADDVKKVGAP